MGEIGGIAQAGIQAIGTGLAYQQQQQAQSDQREMLQRILQQYTNIPLPVLEKMVPQLLGESAEGQVTTDPALQSAEMSSLKQLQDEASQGGMTGADSAAMNLASNQAAGNEQAQRSAIQNMLAARGLGGSGAAVGVMLAGQRQSQDRQATAGQESQIAARQRALQAMQQAGGLAGQIRGQQFSEANAAAKAKDLFAQYNNKSLQNAQQYNLSLAQRNYNNAMDKQGAIAGAETGIVNQTGQAGAQNAATTAGMANGFGQMASAAANQFGGQRPSSTPTPAMSPYSNSMVDPRSQPNPDWSTSY